MIGLEDRAGEEPENHVKKPAFRWKWIVTALVLATLVSGLAFIMYTERGLRAQFVLGGAMVNAGYRLQDHLESYDFEHSQDITPQDVWKEVQKQNELSAKVRATFPRTARHPLVALVVCMDARLDTNELLGDTRHYYYIIRTAGSVLSPREEEMLELAVENGVKLLVLTTHSDCAAEKAASDPESRERYPALAQAVDERQERIQELMDRPALQSRIAANELDVKLINIDTMTERMLPPKQASLD